MNDGDGEFHVVSHPFHFLSIINYAKRSKIEKLTDEILTQ